MGFFFLQNPMCIFSLLILMYCNYSKFFIFDIIYVLSSSSLLPSWLSSSSSWLPSLFQIVFNFSWFNLNFPYLNGWWNPDSHPPFLSSFCGHFLLSTPTYPLLGQARNGWICTFLHAWHTDEHCSTHKLGSYCSQEKGGERRGECALAAGVNGEAVARVHSPFSPLPLMFHSPFTQSGPCCWGCWRQRCLRQCLPQ